MISVTIWENTTCESAQSCVWKVLRYSTFQHFCAVKYLFTNQCCFTFLLHRHFFSLHSTEGPLLFILPLMSIHLTTFKNTYRCRTIIVYAKAVADNYKEINSTCNVFYTECAFKKIFLKPLLDMHSVLLIWQQFNASTWFLNLHPLPISMKVAPTVLLGQT